MNKFSNVMRCSINFFSQKSSVFVEKTVHWALGPIRYFRARPDLLNKRSLNMP